MVIEMAPYRGSWVNAVIDWVGRLPGPPSAAYLVAIVPAIIYLGTADWVSGVRIGVLEPDRVVWVFALIGSIWLIHHLDTVARRAFREFSPMLEATPEERDRLEYELTVIPRTPALLIVGFAALRTAEGFAFQPESEGLAGLTPPALALRFPFEALLTALVLILIYHTIRQLRLVGRIHARSERINLFRPAPLYAFSRLTSWPWQAGTAGAVASAVILPIALFLMTRFLDRVL